MITLLWYLNLVFALKCQMHPNIQMSIENEVNVPVFIYLKYKYLLVFLNCIYFFSENHDENMQLIRNCDSPNEIPQLLDLITVSENKNNK